MMCIKRDNCCLGNSSFNLFLFENKLDAAAHITNCIQFNKFTVRSHSYSLILSACWCCDITASITCQQNGNVSKPVPVSQQVCAQLDASEMIPGRIGSHNASSLTTYKSEPGENGHLSFLNKLLWCLTWDINKWRHSVVD